MAGAADSADLTECLLERPVAEGVGTDDPVAGVGLDCPGRRVEDLATNGIDRRRSQIGDEAERPDRQGLKLGQADQSVVSLFSSTIADVCSPLNSLFKSIDLPGDRGAFSS